MGVYLPGLSTPFYPPLKGADCVLLLDMEGADEGTTFLDSSDSAHTVTALGDANTETSIKKFGSSAYEGTEGGVGRLSIPNSVDFQLTADFTIDCWVYPTNITGFADFICGCQTGSNESYDLQITTSGYLQFSITSDTSTLSVSLIYLVTATQNAWNHVAVTRVGNTYYLFLNGVLGDSATDANAAPSPTGSLYVGANSSGSADNSVFNGYIDEFRIRKGTGEWSSAFTPYKKAYV